jgi:hypothetical protein
VRELAESAGVGRVGDHVGGSTGRLPETPCRKARPGHEAELKKRTLTNLYNAQPVWLVNAHQALDKAVAAAYGWNDYTPDMSNPEILQRLLQLNLAR